MRIVHEIAEYLNAAMGNVPAYPVLVERGDFLVHACMTRLRGFFQPGLDLVLRPELERRNAWRGRGFCCLLRWPDDRWLGRLREAGVAHGELVALAGIALHELGHWFELREQDEAAAELSYDSLMTAFCGGITDQSPCHAAAEQPRHAGHGLEFIRPTLHAWHRAYVGALSVPPVPLKALSVCGPMYGVSDVASYVTAFKRELIAHADKPIADVIKMPMPKAAMELWLRDTEHEGITA